MKQKKYLSIALIYFFFIPKFLFAASAAPNKDLVSVKYGFIFDQCMINTAYSEDQKSFQKKTHKVVQLLSQKIKETENQAKSIIEIIELLAEKRKEMAYEDSVTNDLDRSFFDVNVKKFGARLYSNTGLSTPLVMGTRKEAKNKFLEKLKDKNYRENFIRLKNPYQYEIDEDESNEDEINCSLSCRCLPCLPCMTKKEKKEYEERKKKKLIDISFCHHRGPVLISSELSFLYFSYTTYKGEDLLLSSFSFYSENQCGEKLWSLSFNELYKYTKEIQATACNNMIVEHCPQICSIRTKVLEELQYLYDQYLEKKKYLSKKDEILKIIARIHWLHGQATLHIRGGGWIPETLACILMISADINFSQWNTESWSEVMTNTLEEFVEKYPSLFKIS